MARYLIELTASDGSIWGFDTAGGFSPTDADANLVDAHYYGLIPEGGAPVITRATSGAGSLGGLAGSSFGTIRVLNNDRRFDDMAALGFDGRPLVVKSLPDGAKTVAAASDLYTGTVINVQIKRFEVVVEARDRSEELNVPIGRLVDSAEWPEAEGYRLPVAAGVAKECPVLWVDTVKNIAAIHDGVADVDLLSSPADGGVYDLGVALTRESPDYPDIATLKSTAPAAGKYRLYPSSDGTYIRLGSRPSDQAKIAADIVVTSTDGPSQIQELAERGATISAGDIDASSFTALSRAWEVGGYWPGDTTIETAITEIARSLNCVVFFSRSGKLTASRLTPPASAGARRFFGPQSADIGADADQLLFLDREIVSKPVKEVSIGYEKVHSVKSELQALWGTDPTRAELISREYRRTVVQDNAVAAKHLLAEQEEFDTILNEKANATTVAGERIDERGAFVYTAQVKYNADIGAIELGDRIDVQDDQLLPATGSPDEPSSLIVRSISHDLNSGQVVVRARA